MTILLAYLAGAATVFLAAWWTMGAMARAPEIDMGPEPCRPCDQRRVVVTDLKPRHWPEDEEGGGV